MPFDGQDWLQKSRAGETAGDPGDWLQPILGVAAGAALALVIAAIGTEVASPGFGMISRVVYGNHAVDNRIAVRKIARDAHMLKFTVAGKTYTVMTPSYPLTPEQTAAWLDWSHQPGRPAWPVDGPLAIDP